MTRWLTMSSIQARLLVVSLAIALILIGVSQIRNTSLEIYPEFLPVYVEIQTEALGLSADEVEQLLTVALEQDLLNGIAFLDEIWSESMTGLSRVICVFEPGTDPMKARQVVAERLTQAHALPNVSKAPVMLQPYSSASRVLKIGLTPSSEEMSLIDLSVLARWNIQPYLMGVEGVANVSIWGQRKRQMQVQVNPEVLKEKDVKLKEVIKTTGEALWVSPLTFLESSTPGTGGFFDTPNQRLGVRHVLPITETEHLSNIALHNHENMVLGDVANVVVNHQPLVGDAIVKGQSGLMLVVEKFPWANTHEVTANVEQALAELKPGLSGVDFDSGIYRPAEFIADSKSNLSSGLAIGFALTLIVLMFLFYNWKIATISMISISTSILMGAYILYLNGTTFNMMVIAGLLLALGIIIDDTITSVENIRRRLSNRSQDNNQSTGTIILGAITEMRGSISFATAIILLALIPFYFVGGVTGKFLAPFASSYGAALLASIAVTLTLTPALCMMLFSGKLAMNNHSPFLENLQKMLGSGSTKLIQNPIMAYSLFGVFALTSIFMYPMLNKDFSPPALQMSDLVIPIEAEEGTSLTKMNQLTNNFIQELNKVDGVRNVTAHIGRAVMSDKVENVNAGEIWINMDDGVDYATTFNAINKAMENYEHLSPTVQNYYKQTLDQPIQLSNYLYSVRVYGENQEMLTKKSEEVQQSIASINGISNSKVDYPAMEPIIKVFVDLEKAREHEIRPGDVRRAATTLLSGVEVGSLFEEQKVFGVVVWGTPEIRDNPEDVNNILVDKPDGGHVRLGDVAEVEIIQHPRIINREGVSRYLDVSFDYSGNDHIALASDINNQLSTINFPLEYHAELTGQFQSIDRSNSQLFGLIIACLIGILLLFQAAFSSWRFALLAFVSMLVPLSGGLLVAFLTGIGLSLPTVAGLLAILALATHQGITLIKHFKRLELQENQSFSVALIQQGVQERFIPIVMSTLIIAILFLPFVLFGQIPGLEMIHPMSIVILGGLFTTSLLNLFILPSLYFQFGQNSQLAIEEEKAIMELEPEIRTATI